MSPKTKCVRGAWRPTDIIGAAVLSASRGRGFEAAFTALAQQKASALLLSPDAFFFSRRV
jgi:hypothetical protein